MNDEATQLIPLEQKQVDFYGDELIAVRVEDGRIYVAVRQMCQALGLDSPSQIRRIKRHAILSEGLKGDVKLTYPSTGRGGGDQSANVLRVDLVPLWLSGIRSSTVKEEIRAKIERYQREAAAVLWEAFQEGRLTTDTEFRELLEQADSDAVQAYHIAQAIVRLARAQIVLESRLTRHEQALESYGQRIEEIESTLGDPGRNVTPDQASQISQAVKAVALKLTEKSGRNEYGGVYGELYRKFGVTSYKLLPAGKFEGAMTWLTDWYQSVSQDDVPF